MGREIRRYRRPQAQLTAAHAGASSRIGASRSDERVWVPTHEHTDTLVTAFGPAHRQFQATPEAQTCPKLSQSEHRDGPSWPSLYIPLQEPKLGFWLPWPSLLITLCPSLPPGSLSGGRASPGHSAPQRTALADCPISAPSVPVPLSLFSTGCLHGFS